MAIIRQNSISGISSITAQNNAVEFFTSSGNKLFTTGGNFTVPDGSIGIGTDNPALKLHVEDSSSQIIRFARTGIGAGSLDIDGDGNAVFNSHTINQDVIFHTQTNERFRIFSNGNIRIGTASNPGGKLFFESSSGSAQCIASGGTNNQDLIIGQSSTEFLRITSAGRIGINVTSPEDPLHVKNYSSAAGSIRIQTGKSSTSNGDEYASIILDGTSYTGAKIASHRDDGTWDDRGDLRFYSGYGNNVFTERMRIRNTGQVHIGDDLGVNHSGEFQVINTAGGQQTNDCLAFFETNGNDWIMKLNSNEGGSASHYHMYFMEEGATRGSISGNHGANVTYNQGSDYRWKENIIDLTGTEGIDICKKLKPRKYNWIKNREGTGQINTVDGFIAHEVQEAGVLGAVTGEKDAVNEDGSIDGQMIDYGQMTPVLAAAIKGLIDKVETLETKVAALEGS